jgi:hypothetical protein
VTKRFYLIFFIFGLLIAVAAASFEDAPGYMDADYYYAGALRLIAQDGSGEPYLWNYLNDPAELPAPAFAYWMPLTSYLAAAGLLLFEPLGFWGARFFFIVLAALIPPLTAYQAFQFQKNAAHARLAGLLALFPGFYLAYQTTTDAFPIYFVLGSLFLLAAYGQDWPWLRNPPHVARMLLLGLIAGLMHLTRADGILWLFGAFVVALEWFLRREHNPKPNLLLLWAVILLAYGLVTAPWYVRNLAEWGSLFPPGGSRAVWITEYEQTMIYPASQLTPTHWLATGFNDHLLARFNAFSQNIQTAVAVQGGIVLFPFIISGLWQLRRNAMVRFGVFMWLLTLFAMTVIFPFAGVNGGFFHSGAAVQVLLWAAAPIGVVYLMRRYARWRKFPDERPILRFMSVFVVAAAVILSGVLYYQRVSSGLPGESGWGGGFRHYQLVEAQLIQAGAAASDTVLVNNPPGYWLASGRPAVVIPYGDDSMLYAAAQRYRVRYLVLELTNPWQLAPLYDRREDARSEFEYITSVGTTHLYRVSGIE